MNLIWRATGDKNCPSCTALHGQVHTAEEWEESGIKPADSALMCGTGCNCTLSKTDQPPSGDLSTVPLKLQEHQTEHPMQKDYTLKALATPTEEGFDILAISEGEAKGHGITFNDKVLQSALPLYDSKPVFIDHAGMFEAQSVRNLAGTIHTPNWNMQEKGIQLKLKPVGPAADVLTSLRDAAKSNPAIMQAVGFSTVLRVQLDNKGNVTKIVSVKSVDVVIDPARGGKFLSEINGNRPDDPRARRASKSHIKGVHTMARNKTAAIVQDENIDEQESETRAALELQGANEVMSELQETSATGKEILLAQLQDMLDVGLSNSKLPEPSQKSIRKYFEAKLNASEPFKPTELKEAIKDKREELAALNDSGKIAGQRAGNIGAMFNSQDQLEAALGDLMGAPRDDDKVNLKVHKLNGIREAYLMATGDQSFMGGYFRDAALVSANFPGIVANVQNKILSKAWDDFDEAYGWWKHIVTIEHFNNLKTVSWVRTGTIASLPTVAERGEYTELPIGDIKETSDFSKYGGYVPLTLESVINDDLRAFVRMPKELALAGIRLISELVAAIFTANSGAGPTMTDTGALFNSTAQTTAGGHVNLLTTALGTDYTAWNAVATAMYKKKLMVKNATGYYGLGKPQGLKPSFCLVPADLIASAEALFVPRWEAPAQNVPATQSVRWGGRVMPLAVPDWTDANDWAAVIDPKLRPGIMLGEIFGIKPQIFSAASEIDPAMFANDESRLKVRQFVTVGVADDMPLHKSNVT